MIEMHQEYIHDTYSERFRAVKDQLEYSTTAITNSVKKLITLGVAHHLPIGV
jgi:hypothetical protein